MAKISQLPSIAPTGDEQVVLFDGEKAARAMLSELKLDDATASLFTSAILTGVLIAVPIAGNVNNLRVDLATAANGETFDALIVASNDNAVTRITAGGITRDVVGPDAIPIAPYELVRGQVATFAYSIAGGGFVLIRQRDLSIVTGTASATFDKDFAERPWGAVDFPGGVRTIGQIAKTLVVPGSSNAHPGYVPAGQEPAGVMAAALNEFLAGDDVTVSGVTVAMPGAPMVTILDQLANSPEYMAGRASWVVPFYWMNDARSLFYHDNGGILAEIAALRAAIPAIRAKGAEPVLVTGFPPDLRASAVALDPDYYADATRGMVFPAVKAAPVDPETDMWPPRSAQLTAPVAWTATGIKRVGYKRIDHVNRLIREVAAETGCVLLDLEYSAYFNAIELVPDLGAQLDDYYDHADPLHGKGIYAAAVRPVLRQWASAVAKGDTSQRIFRGDGKISQAALTAAVADATAEANDARDKSKDWAEGSGEPGGAGSKSAKAWSDAAHNAFGAASLAAASAVAAGRLYVTVEAGLAATPDDEYFLVRAAGDRFADLYLRSGNAAVLQPNQLPSAEAIARNLGPTNPFSGSYTQSTGQPGQVHLTGETNNGTSLMHLDFLLHSDAHAYAWHALVTAAAGVTLGGAMGNAMSGPGTADVNVANRYEDGDGSCFRGNRVGSGDGWGALLSASSTGKTGGARMVKQNANGQPGGPCGTGPAMLAENLSDEGTAITSVTAANNLSPISNTFERQNTTGGVISRSQMLTGGPRTSQLTGQDVYLTPNTPSTGPLPVQGFAVTIGANIIGSVEATAVSVTNSASGGVNAYGGVFAVTGDNDFNTGFLALAFGGLVNRAATFVGDVVFGGNAVLNADNAYQFGSPGARIKEIFCANSTINTSDKREKKWLGELTDAHIRAARRIAAGIGSYQWLEQIAEKGEDGARIHFGVKAQDVVETFYDEGLEIRPPEGQRPSFRHGFLCYDEWDDIYEDVMVPGKVIKRFEVPVVTDKRLYSSPKPYATGEMEYRIDPSTGERATELTRVIAFEEDTVGVPEILFEEVEREVDGFVKGGERLVRAAGNQYGLRLGQLAMFLAGANAARLTAIEDKLALLDQAA